MASTALKFGRHLRELRIHLCQTSSSSAGVREFLQKHYWPIKQTNQETPILVRECSGIEPRIWARYEYGKETCIPVPNRTSDDVLKTLTTLSHAAGP